LPVAALAGFSTLAIVQDAKAIDLTKLDPKEIAKQLAENPPFFLKVATKTSKWNEPAEPLKIAGPIYFVLTKGLAVWLIKSSDGLIPMNTGRSESGSMIEASVKKLGFDSKGIKLLLACHAHIDHVGAHAYIQKLSGAKVAIMDVKGGKADFFYAAFTASLTRIIAQGDAGGDRDDRAVQARHSATDS
jgi:glyoxylase-like metal-dependent hydrolase (beta-lactamase superfamily II)